MFKKILEAKKKKLGITWEVKDGIWEADLSWNEWLDFQKKNKITKPDHQRIKDTMTSWEEYEDSEYNRRMKITQIPTPT